MSSLRLSKLADDLFRQEAGKIVAQLVKSLGPQHLQIAEDVVQEAIGKALQTWPYSGIPDNPAGWISATARNLAIDAIRRESLLRQKQVNMFGSVHRWSSQVTEVDFDSFGEEVEDAVLRMMFVCAHPGIAENTQHVLALKTICGFSVEEIGQGLLSSDAAIAKRLTRARERLAEGDITTELPVSSELEARLESVVRTLYLLFNEGYKASYGSELYKPDLCLEAIRLTRLLAGLPIGDRPRVHALLSLMLFNVARLSTRSDSDGNILLLRDQDRSLWDRDLIADGFKELGHAASGEVVDTLQLQATIVALHCSAESYEATDWKQILAVYDVMVQVDASPVIALNRAVAVCEVHGPSEALAVVSRLPGIAKLQSYYLLYAVLAEFERRLGHVEKARDLYGQAIRLAGSESERAFLETQSRNLGS